MAVYCLSAVVVASAPGNEDTRHTGRCSLFLPDNKRVRARAEVKPATEWSITNYEPDFEYTDRISVSIGRNMRNGV